MFEYKQRDRFSAPVDPTRCRASVHEKGRGCLIYQCQRKAVQGKWCKQHHPDAIKARNEASERRYRERMEDEKQRDIRYGLRAATRAQLLAELGRRDG